MRLNGHSFIVQAAQQPQLVPVPGLSELRFSNRNQVLSEEILSKDKEAGLDRGRSWIQILPLSLLRLLAAFSNSVSQVFTLIQKEVNARSLSI